MKKVKPLSPSAVRRHLKPYAIEIGQITLVWNRLHENLALLFWYAIGPEKGGVSFAIWNRLSSDRTQRDILKVVIDAGAFLSHSNGRRIADELLWLLKQIEDLAERRNIAVHAPLTTLTDTTTGITTVAAQDFFGNRRAKSLAKKDILSELVRYGERAEMLSRFAVALIQCMNPSHQPWPKRPTAPATMPRPRRRAKS
jgi:hypothetical protein